MDHRNPFGIQEDAEYFDDLLLKEYIVFTGNRWNINETLAWLEKWQKDNPPQWWSVPVKEWNGKTAMRCGTLAVEASSLENAQKKINEVVEQWSSGQYVPPYAKAKGPFPTKEQAEKA